MISWGLHGGAGSSSLKSPKYLLASNFRLTVMLSERKEV